MKQKLFLALCLSASGVLFAQQDQKIEQLDSVQIDSKTMLSRKNSGKVNIISQITRTTTNAHFAARLCI